MSEHVILIVDDEAGIRRVLQRALAQRGYRVHAAESGEEAFEILGTHPVDLVLMDLRMPRMSGRTLYHAIRSQWPHLAHRVIVMSGDPESPDHSDWLALNDLPILSKPFELTDVTDLVAASLPERRREANGS